MDRTGIVVHLTAGIGALVASNVLGPRKDTRMVAGNLLLTLLGTGMLWVGWFGFNGGSAAAAGAIAAFANLVTHLSASAAGLTWMMLDYQETGKTSVPSRGESGARWSPRASRLLEHRER